MLALDDLVNLLGDLAAAPPAGVHTWIACDDRGYSSRELYDLMRRAGGLGPGRAWLPRWGWRLGAALLDLRGRGGDEKTWDKLFAAELYSNSALCAATGWRPAGALEPALRAIMAGQGAG